jgi:hypothetical protein
MSSSFFPKFNEVETDRLLEAETELFFKDYKKYFVAGETKPPGLANLFSCIQLIQTPACFSSTA